MPDYDNISIQIKQKKYNIVNISTQPPKCWPQCSYLAWNNHVKHEKHENVQSNSIQFSHF